MSREANDHFHMIFKKDNANYMDLPGLTVLVGGMWIVNLNYWGCNQYITQRALGADLKTARKGTFICCFFKIDDARYCCACRVLPPMYYIKQGIFKQKCCRVEN